MSSSTPLLDLPELLAGFRDEIQGYYDDITSMDGLDIPAQTLTIAGIYARVGQIRGETVSYINRGYKELTSFKTQELDPFLDQLQFIQSCFSRYKSMVEAEWKMSKGFP